MMKQVDVNMVRKAVVSHVGSRVKVRANKGRRKIDVAEGIIFETYPSIFLIKIENDSESSFQTMSFSYTDVLTKDVQLTLCN